MAPELPNVWEGTRTVEYRNSAEDIYLSQVDRITFAIEPKGVFTIRQTAVESRFNDLISPALPGTSASVTRHRIAKDGTINLDFPSATDAADLRFCLIVSALSKPNPDEETRFEQVPGFIVMLKPQAKNAFKVEVKASPKEAVWRGTATVSATQHRLIELKMNAENVPIPGGYAPADFTLTYRLTPSSSS